MRKLHAHGATGSFEDADHYDRFAGRLMRRTWDRIADDVAALGLPPGAHVLDVGTGPGRLPVAVGARSPQLRVTGVDVSAPMVERARELAAEAGLGDRVDAALADVADLPFPDGSIHLVLSTLSQHHWPDPAAGFRELARVLAPGGRLWVYDARWVLARAQQAAQPAFGPREVRREPARGPFRLPLLGRLAVAAG